MAIDSSSTLAEVQAAYDDNASYAEDGSATKCRAFLTAARILLRRVPAETNSREGGVRFSLELIRDEIQRATEWLQSQPAGSGAGESSTGGPRVILMGTQYPKGRC